MNHASAARLERILADMPAMTIAVSGGVDSVALATLAHRLHPEGGVLIAHAVSPAVPADATARVRARAHIEGWELKVIDAGEFRDPDYLRNPVDRCFYCKHNLYGAIRGLSPHVIVSGTNADDLSDFRPGLAAASQFAVRHPYVEAGMGKADVRALAKRLELEDVAELPASPCLSSRIETGLEVEADLLALVHAVERLMQAHLHPQTVRCRIRRQGLVVELDERALAKARLDAPALRRRIELEAASANRTLPVSFAPYRLGSAFLRAAAP